jgi:GNAT superfamily N-acetyltransferase
MTDEAETDRPLETDAAETERPLETGAAETERPLETGWLADTPPGDTVARAFVLGMADWMESVARASGGPVQRTDDFVIVDEHSPHLLFNTGVLLRPLDNAGAEKVVAEIAGFYAGGGGPYSVFSPFPVALPGLEIYGHPPLMLRVAGGEAPPVPAGLEITAATTRGELEDYERVLVDGFPLDELKPWRAGTVFHPANLHVPDTQFFVGRVDGQPVTCAASLVGCGVNHVEFVATLPEARGKGYGAAVTWAATLARPELHALLIASDMGRPIYERMGYVPIGRWTLFVGRR